MLYENGSLKNHHSQESERWPGLQAGELFYLLPERIEQRPLRAGAKLAFAVLKFHGRPNNHCHPSLPTLGQKIGVGEKQARTYKNELVKKCLIEEELSRGPGWANRYFQLDPARRRVSWIPSKNKDDRKHSSLIPKKVMESMTLSHEAKIVYGRLRRLEFVSIHVGKAEVACLPAYAELALMVGISPYQAKRCVAQLEAANLLLLDRENLCRDEEGRGGTFGYRILPPRA